MSALHTLLVFLFACLLLYAAFCDVRRFEIPNAVPLALLGLYPVYAATFGAPASLLAAPIVALVVFAVGVVLYARGVLGAGDVKLFAAASLWIGPGRCLDFVTATAAIGGVLAVILLTGAGHAAFDRLRASSGDVAGRIKGFRRPMPYGVAITAGALLTLLPPVFSE
jgi:prepilin peptidase CpaA